MACVNWPAIILAVRAMRTTPPSNRVTAAGSFSGPIAPPRKMLSAMQCARAVMPDSGPRRKLIEALWTLLFPSLTAR